MCLIVVKKKGIALPPEKYLKNGFEKNKDGLGIAVWKKDSALVHIKKDFKGFLDFKDYLNTNVSIDDACIIHFRLGTHGLMDSGNRHPFPITHKKELLRTVELDCELAVAHNGVLSQYSKLDDKELSDTQRFILDILSEPIVMANLKTSGIQKLIDQCLGGDRLSILFPDGDIMLLGDFEEEDAILYSNSLYKVAPYNWGGYKGCQSWSRFGESHWDRNDETPTPNTTPMGFLPNLSNPTPQPTKEASPNQNTVSPNSLLGKCEHCLQVKVLRIYESAGQGDDKGEMFLLCKKCRKKANSGKINLGQTAKEWANGEKIPIDVRCDCCREFVKQNTLKLIMNEFWACKNCYSQYAEIAE